MSFKLRTSLRTVACTTAVGLSLVVPAFIAQAHASPIDETIPTPEIIAQLEQRASQASPHQQAYLYTELVHKMTEMAGKQLSDGDTEHATDTINKIGHYVHLIHVNLGKDAWRLKEAEMLMNHTVYRLGQFMHFVSGDDKANLQTTLAQLDQVNNELLTQVFQHY
jgi:hypothetical protein